MRTMLTWLLVLVASTSAFGQQPPMGKCYSDDPAQRALEFQLTMKLYTALEAWQDSQDPQRVAECEGVADRLITEGDPSVEAYYMAAKTEELVGNVTKAKAILEQVLLKLPNNKTPGFDIPVSISANLWLGRLRRDNKEFGPATEAFNRAGTAAESKPLFAHLKTLSRMYQGEQHGTLMKDKAKAEALFGEAVSAPKTGGTQGMPEQFFSGWARHLSERNKGAAKADTMCSGESLMLVDPMIREQLSLNGIIISPCVDFYGTPDEKRFGLWRMSLEKVVSSSNSEIDKESASLLLGQVQSTKNEPGKADENFKTVYKSESFLAPVGGVALGQSQLYQGKDQEGEKILDEVGKKWPASAQVMGSVKESAKARAAHKRSTP